jgi:hypothetical protein
MEMEMEKGKGLFSVPFALCRWPPSAPPRTPLSQCQRSAPPGPPCPRPPRSGVCAGEGWRTSVTAPITPQRVRIKAGSRDSRIHGPGKLNSMASTDPERPVDKDAPLLAQSRRCADTPLASIFCFQQPTYGVQRTARCTCTAATPDAATTARDI